MKVNDYIIKFFIPIISKLKITNSERRISKMKELPKDLKMRYKAMDVCLKLKDNVNIDDVVEKLGFLKRYSQNTGELAYIYFPIRGGNDPSEISFDVRTFVGYITIHHYWHLTDEDIIYEVWRLLKLIYLLTKNDMIEEV